MIETILKNYLTNSLLDSVQEPERKIGRGKNKEFGISLCVTSMYVGRLGSLERTGPKLKIGSNLIELKARRIKPPHK